MKSRTVISLALLLFSPLFFLDLRALPDYIDPLYPLAHLGFFFALTAQLLRHSRLRGLNWGWQAGIALLLAVGVGGSIEWLQLLTGRDGSWDDLAADVAGAALGFSCFAPSMKRQSWRLRVPFMLGAIAAVAMQSAYPLIDAWDVWLAQRQYPMLSDFESQWQARRWTRGTLDHSVAREGQGSLRVVLTTDNYSGTSMRRGLGDWTQYQHLRFSVFNPDETPVTLTVSVRDLEHFRRGAKYLDRFNRQIIAKPGWNDIDIATADIRNAPKKRQLDLNAVQSLMIFAVNRETPTTIYLDQIRLEP